MKKCIIVSIIIVIVLNILFYICKEGVQNQKRLAFKNGYLKGLQQQNELLDHQHKIMSDSLSVEIENSYTILDSLLNE